MKNLSEAFSVSDAAGVADYMNEMVNGTLQDVSIY